MDTRLEPGSTSQCIANIEVSGIPASFYRKAFEGLPFFAFIADSNGVILDINSAAKKVFGSADFTGKDVSDLIRPCQKPETLGPVFSALESGGQWQGETRVVGPGGVQLQLEIAALRIKDSLSGYTDIFVGRDITLRRSLERTACQEEKAATRGEMAGEIAHELNNHLSIIMGNMELMGMALEKGKIDSLATRLKNMREGVGRITRFVEGLMSLCNPQARLEIFHLQRLIDEEIFFLSREPRFGGVDFICDWDEALPALEADRARLRQAIINILTNSADAVANNVPGRRTITVTMKHLPDDGLIHLTILDNGPGMSDEDYGRAFRQFFTTKGPGHGFGLLTVKGAIKSAGGKITVSPGLEGGVCVIVDLPVKSAKSKSMLQ